MRSCLGSVLRRRHHRLVPTVLLASAGCSGSGLGRPQHAEPLPPLEAPGAWLSAPRAYPGEITVLPASVALDALLAGDVPDALAITDPGSPARVRRGESITFRFNRPMVEAVAVGRELAQSPVRFQPAVPGKAQWTSRSTLSFRPEPRVFDRTFDARATFEGLRSLAGEPLAPDTDAPRIVRFDATPAVLFGRVPARLPRGEAIPLPFDGPVTPDTLTARMMVFTADPRHAPVTVTLETAPQRDGAWWLLARPTDPLAEGTMLSFAFSPAFDPWSGPYSAPHTVRVEIAPPPRIEGLDCPAAAEDSDACNHRPGDGEVLEVDTGLGLFASEPLAAVQPSMVRITPPVENLRIRTTANGNATGSPRRLEIEGDWMPDQPYALRLEGLRTASGRTVRTTPVLALRSRGKTPAVEMSTGLVTFERDLPRVMPLRAIHAERGSAMVTGLTVENVVGTLRAIHGEGDTPATGRTTPLQGTLPSMRPNRWGAGGFAWGADPDGARLAFLRVTPLAQNGWAGTAATALVQSTNLALHAQASDQGLLVWVTSLDHGQPVEGARIEASSAGTRAAPVVTDGQGLAFVPRGSVDVAAPWNLLARAGDDAAVLRVDPRTAIGAAGLGLAAGGGFADPRALHVATVLDRGIYRPGDTVRALLFARTFADASLRAAARTPLVAELRTPSGGLAARQRSVTQALGSGDVSFPLERDAVAGTWTIRVTDDNGRAVLASTPVNVSDFRPPTLRIDATLAQDRVVSGGTVEAHVRAEYLFGAPLAAGTLRWRMRRAQEPHSFPSWPSWVFQPVDADDTHAPRTVDEGMATLGDAGTADVRITTRTAGPTPERVTLQLDAEAGAGEHVATFRTALVEPAEFVVGLHDGPTWVDPGTSLDVQALVLSHDGAPVAGRTIEARVVREAWNGYWEWAGPHDDEDEDEGDSAGARGAWQSRRARSETVVHTCRLTSAQTPVRCVFQPTAAGTYRLEVRARDAAGREVIASRRTYVAARGEVADRDPPGGLVTLTPDVRSAAAGTRIRLAYESPWDEARALLYVHVPGAAPQSPSVSAAHLGGNVAEVQLQESMIPTAYVSLVLVKGRTAPPGATVDAGRPDVRWGITEIAVFPAATPLAVEVHAARAVTLPGEPLDVDVSVRGLADPEHGGEVAVFAVDEGVLRLTDHHLTDPIRGLLPRRGATLSIEDLRRTLLSRVAVVQAATPSGDGGDEAPDGPPRDDRERFDPTPVWLPHVALDAQGHARVRVTLPERNATYRFLALANDGANRAAHAEAQVVVNRPVVVRPLMPRFAVEGDVLHPEIALTDTLTTPVDATVEIRVSGAAARTETVHLLPARENRIPLEVTAGAQSITVAVVVRDPSGSQERRWEIPVRPRARWARARRAGALAPGGGDLQVTVAEGARIPGGMVRLSLASVGLVGADELLLALAPSDDDIWGDTEGLDAAAARAKAWAALQRVDPRRAVTTSLEEARETLLREMHDDDATERLSSIDLMTRVRVVTALRALALEPGSALERRLQAWDASVRRDSPSVLATLGNEGRARILAALAAGGQRDVLAVDGVYAQRDLLGLQGLRWLHETLPPSDPRRAALSRLAAERLRPRTGAGTRITVDAQSAAHALIVVLEHAEQQALVGPLVERLLEPRLADTVRPWGSPVEAAEVFEALALHAARLVREHPDLSDVQLRVDGAPLAMPAGTGAIARFDLGTSLAAGVHTVHVESPRTVFFTVEGRWAEPLTPADAQARGVKATLHRVIETRTGHVLRDGEHVHRGETLRVRLYVHREDAPPPALELTDSLGAGFESQDPGLATSARDSLEALLGLSGDDLELDPRARYALRGVETVQRTRFGVGTVQFRLGQLPTELIECTYAIRAAHTGTFTLPPAVLRSPLDFGFEARSGSTTIVVDP